MSPVVGDTSTPHCLQSFPRERQLELFQLLASPRKVLRAHPGRHADTWPEDEQAWLEHIDAHLGQ